MGGGDLNLKKSWHPNTLKNQEKVWKAEQAKNDENRKLEDLRKEIAEERDREDLKRIGKMSGVLPSSNDANAKLEWMYKNSNDLINRDEYLLGRSIDKSFERLQAEEQYKEKNKVGVKQPLNHVEHECLPASIRDYRNLESTEQVDLPRKMMEDPLMLIKQREMESRRKLLENPVKLKEIHRLLKSEKKLSSLRKAKKSKKSTKKKKKRSHSGSSDSDTESSEDLDSKLEQRYKELKEKDNNFSINKILEAKYKTLSKELKKVAKQNQAGNSKHNSRRDSSKRRSSSDGSSSRDDPRYAQTQSSQRDHQQNYYSERGRGTYRENGSKNNWNHFENKRGRSERENNISNQSERSRRERSDSRSSNDKRPKDTRRNRDGSRSRNRSPASSRNRSRSRSRNRSRSRKYENKKYLSSVKESKDNVTYKRKVSETPTQKTNEKKKLTEEEKQARLKEMMDNAVWREADRTVSVRKHREAYAREEAQNQSRNFDKNFINKEIQKAISNHESIGSRIRSNLNNIQRTPAAMDKNFARK